MSAKIWSCWCLCSLVCVILDTSVDAIINSNAQSRCFPELGCFPMGSPWTSPIRPFPAPFTPTQINTRLYYYSRTSPQRFNITLWPSICLNGADFSCDRQATAFITHGFANNGNATWMSKLKDKYLNRVDANVFLVDWGDGAGHSNYLQVASNIRVVGAEVARFVQWLADNHRLNLTTVHLMGHSLGAHTSAYVGKRVPTIGHITGFDPAQPGFELAAKEVRLDKCDADFVEIIHTNSMPFIPLCGVGVINSFGHVDFYVNGGALQPGCKKPLTIIKELGKGFLKLKNIKDLLSRTVEEVSEWVSCSHGRSYMYYTESLNSSCPFWGQKASIARQIVNAGTAGLLDPLFKSLENCTEETCLPLGLDTPLYKARGSFLITTSRTAPYCCKNDAAANKVLKSLSNTINRTKERIQKAVKKAKEFGNAFKRHMSWFANKGKKAGNSNETKEAGNTNKTKEACS